MAAKRYKVDGVEAIYVDSGSSGASIITARANFPAPGTVTGQFAINTDNNGLYIAYNNLWNFIAILNGE